MYVMTPLPESPVQGQPASESADRENDRLREKLHQREQQLASQPAIEQAKGMLMQDFQLSPDAAFEVLKRLSQDSNTKVRDIAQGIVDELRGAVSEQTSRITFEAVEKVRRRESDDQSA